MTDSRKAVVVLGGGPAGLGAAYFLAKAGRNVVLLEKESHVGGMGASIRIGKYIADYGPHTFHLKKSVVTRLFERLVGPDVNKVVRNAKLWIYGKSMPFPLRIQDALTKFSPWMSSRIVIDYLYQQTCGLFRGKEPSTFEEWGTRQFGHTLFRLAFGNYSEKMWGLPASQLHVKLGKQKLIGLSLWRLILASIGLLEQGRADAMGLTSKNLYDAYPKLGIGTFFETMADEVRKSGGRIDLNTNMEGVEVVGGRVCAVRYSDATGSHRIECDALISSIPLPSLAPLLPADQFAAAQDAASRLKYRSLICVHLVLDKERFSDAHWTYLLDPRLMSNRLSEQKHLCRDSCPAGQTMVTLDITCNYDDYLWKADDSFLIGRGMNDLKVMALHPRTIHDAFVMRAAQVYPIYSLDFETHVDTLINRFRKVDNLFTIGRHGLLLNNDMHDSIEMGFLASQTLMEGKPSAAWYDSAKTYVRDRLEGIVRDPIKFEMKEA
jgi:protoporphyrinogen oxidase